MDKPKSIRRRDFARWLWTQIQRPDLGDEQRLGYAKLFAEVRGYRTDYGSRQPTPATIRRRLARKHPGINWQKIREAEQAEREAAKEEPNDSHDA